MRGNLSPSRTVGNRENQGCQALGSPTPWLATNYWRHRLGAVARTKRSMSGTHACVGGAGQCRARAVQRCRPIVRARIEPLQHQPCLIPRSTPPDSQAVHCEADIKNSRQP
jgi:hypothetical protein